MAGLRSRATVRCGPVYGPGPCDPSAAANKHCLYDVLNDPCEKNNLADIYPTVARALKRTLVRYRSGLVPQPKTPQEPLLADPKRFGGAWSPWQEGPESASQLAPALPPEEETTPAPPKASKPAPGKTTTTKSSTADDGPSPPATATEDVADKEEVDTAAY